MHRSAHLLGPYKLNKVLQIQADCDPEKRVKTEKKKKKKKHVRIYHYQIQTARWKKQQQNFSS